MLYAIKHLITGLKKARVEAKLSQGSLAAKIGIPQSHISMIESGKVNPRLSSFLEIARTLGLEVVLVPRKKVLLVESILRLKSKKSPEDNLEPAYIPDKDINDE